MNPTSDTARVPFPSSPPKTQNTRQPSIVIPTSNSSAIPSRRTNLSRPSPLSRLHSSPGASRPEADKNRPGMFKAPPSPCYVHSHLEKYGQLPAPPYNHTPWNSTSQQSLGGKHEEQEKRRDGQAGLSTQKADPPLSRTSEISTPASAQEQSHTPYAADIVTGLSAVSTIHPDASDGSRVKSRLQVSAPAWEDLDDAEDGGSITRQLAETATGVREMSKQLGRTKVKSNIQHVLIVTKARDNGLIKLTREVAVYLMNKKTGNNGRSNGRGMVVYVDSQLRTSKRFNAAGLEKEHPEFFKPYPRRRSSSSASIHTLSTSISEVSLLSRASSISGAKRRSDNGRDADNDQGQLRYWTADMCSNTPNLFDFVVTLGGDGTVLFTSWLFQRIVPPVLPFALGSLGFLTNFDYSNFQKTIDHVVDDGIRVNLRMRFTCVVYRAVAPDEVKHKGSNRKAIKSTGGDILISRVGKQGWDALENTNAGAPPCKQKKDKEIMCYTTRPVETFEVLNDLVVDRGPSPYVSLLELFGDDHHLTTVQADGLCIATPTGSTAYSLSAGGSLVHPGIPALLISPICPHTLSFRPMLLPDSMEVRVCVPYNSRSTAWASFDGRGRIELKQGDYIKVTASKYPFPTVCAEERSVDWFQSISRTLRWNEREKQKSFVVVEEDRPKSAKEKLSKNADRRETTTGTFKPTEDERRLKASKQEAQDGQDSLAQKTDDESKRQAKQRGDLVQDEETDETSEEEEEEGFDIDDISSNTAESTSPKESREESPAARPKYSSKRPSQLAGLLGQDGMKSGVDTPDRFFFPQKAHPGGPLSPKAFTSALNRGLTKLSGREKLDESSKREPQGKGVDKGGQHDDISEVSLRPSMADDGGSSGRHEEDEERPDLGTPKPVQPLTPAADSPDGGEDRAGSDHVGHRTKAFAFYGQDESDSSGDEDTQHSDH